MEQSVEAAAAVEAWYARMSTGDAESAVALLVDDPETFAIGTQRIGPGREEWVESIAGMTAMGVKWQSRSLRGWEAGGGGFTAGEVAAVLPDGTELPMRVTAFIVRGEDGVFRIFNMHFSWAVPDEVGFEQAGAWRDRLGLASSPTN